MFESFDYVAIVSLDDMFYVAPKEFEIEAMEDDEMEPEIPIVKFTADDLMRYIAKVKVFRYN